LRCSGCSVAGRKFELGAGTVNLGFGGSDAAYNLAIEIM
jgi:hypothetical protein